MATEKKTTQMKTSFRNNSSFVLFYIQKNLADKLLFEGDILFGASRDGRLENKKLLDSVRRPSSRWRRYLKWLGRLRVFRFSYRKKRKISCLYFPPKKKLLFYLFLLGSSSFQTAHIFRWIACNMNSLEGPNLAWASRAFLLGVAILGRLYEYPNFAARIKVSDRQSFSYRYVDESVGRSLSLILFFWAELNSTIKYYSLVGFTFRLNFLFH